MRAYDDEQYRIAEIRARELEKRAQEKEAKAIEAQGGDPWREVFAIVNKHGYDIGTNVTREDEFLEPFGPGDGRLSSRTKVIDVSEEKQTRPGKGVFLTTIIEYNVEAHDRPVVRARNVLLMYNSSSPREGG